MTNTIAQRKLTVKQKTLYTAAGIVAAVVLPEIFHMMGKISGIGVATGEFFLPMHIPVILVSMIAGPVVGAIVGAVSPIISFFISGMPSQIILPFMIVELLGYGITAGLLERTKLGTFTKLVITQLSGRVLRIGATSLAIYAFSFSALGVEAMYVFIAKGVFGIVLQWAVILPIMKSYKARNC